MCISNSVLSDDIFRVNIFSFLVTMADLRDLFSFNKDNKLWFMKTQTFYFKIFNQYKEIMCYKTTK